MAIVRLLFGICGNVTGVLLFLAPTITFKRIIVNKSTEKFSGIPYVMCLLNCFLFAWYGLPFVSPHNTLVTILNVIGAVIETVYVFIFILFAPKKEKVKIFGIIAFMIIMIVAVIFISLFALHGKSRKIFCGCAAAIFSAIMYGSPLSIMRLVIQTKSVEFMPFFLSLFVFLCGTSWSVYALIGRDPFVIVPNLAGSILGTMQLILYFIYRENKGETKKKPTMEEESMEMGTMKPPSSKEATQSNSMQTNGTTQGEHI